MLDLAGNYEKVGKVALERIAPELAKMGLSLTQFFVENISLPPEVEEALDKRSQMGVLGQPRPVHEVPDGRGDPRRGEEPRRPGRAWARASGAGVAIGQQMAGALAGAAARRAWSRRAHTAVAPRRSAAAAGRGRVPRGHRRRVRPGRSTWPRSRRTSQGGQAHADDARLEDRAWPSWAAAETVPELQALFADVPPPLPG